MIPIDEIMQTFNTIREEAQDNDEVASRLILAATIKMASDHADHNISMGIRHGLFGANASEYSTIKNYRNF